MIHAQLAPAAALVFAMGIPAHAQGPDPLPSWNEGRARQAVLDFVTRVTRDGSPDFVPPDERFAVFDNDGTLWTEQPMYTQLAFAIDRVRSLAPEHPGWKTTQPFQAALDNDLETLARSGETGLVELVTATHSGMTPDTFDAIVKDWLQKARHPRFQRFYTDLTYKPMVELLNYLRSNGFKTYIVTGGGVEFVRAISQKLYGIPPEQIIGSSVRLQYQLKNGEPTLIRRPEIDFIDDRAGKPVGIHKFIGRRPIAAFGNSAGDREMLEWTGHGHGARLRMLVSHDDAAREYSYGPADDRPNTPFGAFPQSLRDEANRNGWVIISMKNDWNQIFHFKKTDNRTRASSPGR